MDDSALTSQAIAELMRCLPGQSINVSSEPLERKINPLGKPNKKFLGRTIHNVLRHNKRENERTQASCQQKLQELDDTYERRKRNVFYNCNRSSRNESGTSKSSLSKKFKFKKRHRSRSRDRKRIYRSSSRESGSHSRIRKTKKHHKSRNEAKPRKRKGRRSNSSSSSSSTTSSEEVRKSARGSREELAGGPTPEYYVHSNNLALAVAMAYSQVLCAHQLQVNNKKELTPASSSSDIVRELMSDDEASKEDIQSDAISIASSGEEREIVTIDLSTQEEQSDGSTGTVSETESNGDSCISLQDSDREVSAYNSSSDIEILENESEQPIEQQSRPLVKSTQHSEPQVACSTSDITASVDLTDD